MRKIFSILFLIVFLFNIMGYYPVFLLRQQNIRNELTHIINQNIASGILTVLSFEKSQINSLQWLKKNEFSYKGDLFDVIMTESRENGKIYYYCFVDKKEKHLIVQLEKHVSRNIADNDKNQKSERNFIKNLAKEFFAIKNEFLITSNAISLDFITIVSNYHSLIPPKHAPPPKSV
jgi:hypothetical protein